MWKDLGLGVTDADGSLLSPDDPRVVEVVRHAGDLGLPVLIHTADLIAFFTPLDVHNERLEELALHRDWWFGDPRRFPTFDAYAALVLACPQTRFVGAHAGCAAEDLDRVERLLDAAPHYGIDIAGRTAELGRQPRRFARLVRDHPGQILFSTDVFPASAEQLRLHFRSSRPPTRASTTTPRATCRAKAGGRSRARARAAARRLPTPRGVLSASRRTLQGARRGGKYASRGSGGEVGVGSRHGVAERPDLGQGERGAGVRVDQDRSAYELAWR